MAEHYLKQELYQQIQQNTDLFDFIQKAALDGIWYWDIEHPENEWMSPEFWTLLGYDPAEKQHLSSEWKNLIFPEDLAEAEKNFKAHFEDRAHPYDQVVRYRHKDGSTVWVRCRGLGIRDNQGKVVRLLGAHNDITELKQVEESLRHATQDAIKANQTKSQFLANMSHELRTPLNAIIGLSELASNEPDHSKLQDKLSKINQSGRLLLNIISDILDLSKVEANQLDIARQTFMLADVLDMLKSLHQEKATEKSLNLSITCDCAVDKVYLGDELRLTQVLSNLLSNAIKFTDQGEVKLKVSLETSLELSEPDAQLGLMFEVSDTGIGISPAQQSRLFKPFSQVDESRSRKYSGTGLGLVISQHFIKAMGGTRIQINSKLGEGSLFSFGLPLTLANAGAAASKTIKPLDSLATQFTGKVLVADDNTINREVLDEILSQKGLTIIQAENGRQALDLVRQQPFDLVLMDLQMPIMNGYEATQLIREFNLTVPIIAVTAAATKEDKTKALSLGMNGHITKPIDLDQLYSILKHWLTAN